MYMYTIYSYSPARKINTLISITSAFFPLKCLFQTLFSLHKHSWNAHITVCILFLSDVFLCILATALSITWLTATKISTASSTTLNLSLLDHWGTRRGKMGWSSSPLTLKQVKKWGYSCSGFISSSAAALVLPHCKLKFILESSSAAFALRSLPLCWAHLSAPRASAKANLKCRKLDPIPFWVWELYFKTKKKKKTQHLYVL